MIVLWIGFVCLIVLLLVLDLGVLHSRGRVMHPKEALAWTGFWVALALGFNILIYAIYEYDWLGAGTGMRTNLSGRQAALEFFAGYLLEESLSVDNLFVIALIFTFFRVPPSYQHRLLFWGILGAMILRGIMITLGSALLHYFDWIIYVLGGFLVLSAVKLLITRHDNLEPDRNPLVRLARRFYPVSSHYDGERFFTRLDGRHAITPLFLVLLVVESTDLMFAVDSIPAIFAVTQDPFLVFTSNVFAILGLRSMFFALAGMMDKFRYLKLSLVFVLAFVGIKMLLSHAHPIPTVVSLCFILGILLVGVVASVLANDHDTARLLSPLGEKWRNAVRLGERGIKRVVFLTVGSTLLKTGVVVAVWPGSAPVVLIIAAVVIAAQVWYARHLIAKRRAEGVVSGEDIGAGGGARSKESDKNQVSSR